MRLSLSHIAAMFMGDRARTGSPCRCSCSVGVSGTRREGNDPSSASGVTASCLAAVLMLVGVRVVLVAILVVRLGVGVVLVVVLRRLVGALKGLHGEVQPVDDEPLDRTL